MTNPRYVDDPDFYEKPGETVHLITDVNPPRIMVPQLPWQEHDAAPTRQDHMVALGMERPSKRGAYSCVVCSRPTRSAEHLTCDYCNRAQHADETAKARARQPTLSTPRIHIREGWERYAQETAAPAPSQEPTIREYETRLD